MKPAIRVEGLTKRYSRQMNCGGEYQTLRESLMAAVAPPWRRRGESTPGAFDALRDVSIDVQPGEVVGLIGRNGAGKSTLLKILSRITEPTTGRIEMRGRIASLLEVGTGFHPELTGRENIYLNGAILGMKRREIQSKFDEIVAFSEIGEFLDTPVKRYSSGMYVRLAFAVAAHLDPEILVVDEVLAVGDIAFQRKCLGRMQEVSRSGRTVIFVSHNMAAVEALCNRGVVLDRGELTYAGDVQTSVKRYYQLLEKPSGAGRVTLSGIGGSQRVCPLLDFVELLDETGHPSSYVRMGGGLHFRIGIKSSEMIEGPSIGIGIDDRFGQRALTVHTPLSIPSVARISGGCVVQCQIPHLPLAPGDYWVKIAVSVKGRQLDLVEKAIQFAVVNADAFSDGRGYQSGYCVAPSTWDVDVRRCAS